MGCFSGCLMSSAGIQKLFCGIYSTFKCSFDEFVGEKVFSPSYSSAILAPPPLSLSFCQHSSSPVQRSTIVRYFRISVLLFCLNPTVRQTAALFLVNRSCTGAWKLPPWSKLGNVSAHLICFPYLCATWCSRSKNNFPIGRSTLPLSVKKKSCILLLLCFTKLSFHDKSG